MTFPCIRHTPHRSQAPEQLLLLDQVQWLLGLLGYLESGFLSIESNRRLKK
jgi:hypothetical protein